MTIEIYESNTRKNGVPMSVMVMEGAGIPAAVQSKGVTWTLRTVLDSTKRSRPWAPWVTDVIETIKRDGYAVRAFGVVVEVASPPHPNVVVRFASLMRTP